MAEGGLSPVPREARRYQGRPAGLVSRVVAATIDGLLVVLALLAGYGVVIGILFLASPKRYSFPDPSLILSLGSLFIVLVVYLTVSWRIRGRTYGCLVMGLRVVGPRGRNIRLGLALVRAILYAAFPIGLFWVSVSRENRSVQDMLLRTAVIYDWRPGDLAGHGQPPAMMPDPTGRERRSRRP